MIWCQIDAKSCGIFISSPVAKVGKATEFDSVIVRSNRTRTVYRRLERIFLVQNSWPFIFFYMTNEYKRRMPLERKKWPFLGGFIFIGTSTHSSDKVGEKAANLAILGHCKSMIEDCYKKAGGDSKKYLFKAVTEGKSYAVLNPPYRAFFYLLDKVRYFFIPFNEARNYLYFNGGLL